MNAEPLPSPRVRSPWWWIAGTGAFLAALCLLLFLFNPEQHGFYPRCLFRAMTGLDCPGCGGLRATHQLLHGNLREAFAFNPLLIILLPFLGIWFVYQLVQMSARKRPFKFALPRIWIWLLAGVGITFGILRNFSMFSSGAP